MQFARKLISFKIENWELKVLDSSVSVNDVSTFVIIIMGFILSLAERTIGLDCDDKNSWSLVVILRMLMRLSNSSMDLSSASVVVLMVPMILYPSICPDFQL